MAVNNALDYRETDPRAAKIVGTVQAMKGQKHLMGVCLIEPCAIVPQVID